MKNEISINKYMYFDTEMGKFYLTSIASEIIYRKKELICSYSGANEWINHFTCGLIDFYSGSSIYNYALGTTEHEKEIPRILKISKEAVIDFINKSIEEPWGKLVYRMIENIIDEASVLEEE
ncbi:hypothetical protein [Clostridium estertheticum]|uniref:hypothetical protein n=1 Tax=Clostridium estertheticum TaxID=238834 RepID=UPI001C0C85FD|nr:hypothetical protein [Clostridium estertheticum]MBU3186566.1 hypothetical protein [Clostridium estertheticum]